MTLREEISKSRADARSDTWRNMTDDEIEQIIKRVDDHAELLNRLEIKLFSLSVNQPPVSSMPTIPEDALKEPVKIFTEVIAEIKRELAAKSEKEA
jgi:hypothetical protein